MNSSTRRTFLRQLGLSAAALPFLPVLPSLAQSAPGGKPQRIIFLFTPNGTIPPEFWPDQTGPDFQLKRILAPLEPFKSRLMTLHGIHNKVRGDNFASVAWPLSLPSRPCFRQSCLARSKPSAAAETPPAGACCRARSGR